ncbi:TOMM precursor leader peptide-binding protein [Nocardioides sp. LHG3406-4]|uniref:TOMM precursor leader peptide-binding protein n=1 Tax=Nocardioides sp. LHG3406-4 TaxID=2804575 RepID=UPI003CE7835A
MNELWGKLLVAGHQPDEIHDAIASFTGAPDRGDPPGEDLLAGGQTQLLGLLGLRDGLLHESSDDVADVGRRLQETLGSSTLAVFASSDDVALDVVTSLSRVGIRDVHVVDSGEAGVGDLQQDVALTISATRGPDRALARMVNRACVSAARPALFVHQHSTQVQLGPLTVPGETACYACYEKRRDAALSPWERSILGVPADSGDLAHPLGLDWLAVESIKHLTRIGEPATRGRVLFIDYFGGLPEMHTLLRVPDCKVCRPPRRPARRLWDEPGGAGDARR